MKKTLITTGIVLAIGGGVIMLGENTNWKECGNLIGQRQTESEIALKFSKCKEEYIITKADIVRMTNTPKGNFVAQKIYDETGFMFDVSVDENENIKGLSSDENTRSKF